MGVAKPLPIPKKLVWEAYLRVKASDGGPGVDGQTIEDFEVNLKDNLYRIWNRMSSGSYFPPPVKLVVIPKSDGRERRLGVPTVADRVAQNVVKLVLEPIVEPQFHPDSYGYRPGRSAHDAIGQARRRCWRYDWVLDLDIRAFFDTLDHRLTLRAVRRYTSCRWVLLYVERWLQASLQREDGSLEERKSGTPQGGVISPLIANIFMHLAFDTWMGESHPDVPFERYADDIVIHCRTGSRPERFNERSTSALHIVDLRSTRRRRNSSIAGTPIGGAGTRRSALTSSGIRSSRAVLATDGVSSSRASALG